MENLDILQRLWQMNQAIYLEGGFVERFVVTVAAGLILQAGRFEGFLDLPGAFLLCLKTQRRRRRLISNRFVMHGEESTDNPVHLLCSTEEQQ